MTAKPNGMLDARDYSKALLQYHTPSNTRGLFELAITLLPLVILWTVAWLTYSIGQRWWAPLLIAIPAAGFLVRLFIIQHDCGHGAFFPNRRVNDWVGRAIGVLSLTPYDWWRRTHASHHAYCGNLDRRGIGDVTTLTVQEYLICNRWERLRYRLYRNPIILFGLGPAYLFLLQHRLPVGLIHGGWRPWISTQGTNAGIFLISGLLIWLIGPGAFFLVHLPIMLLAALVGVWLFYIQHQFENTRWYKQNKWSVQEAALQGSSHYDLPSILRWFTGNIGIHHVHHLNSRIPFYRLPKTLRDQPELREIGRVTLVKSLRYACLTLWDEQKQRLVSFRDIPLSASSK